MVLMGGSRCPKAALRFCSDLFPISVILHDPNKLLQMESQDGGKGTDKGKETVCLRYSVSREPCGVTLDLEGLNACKKLGLAWWYSHLAA